MNLDTTAWKARRKAYQLQRMLDSYGLVRQSGISRYAVKTKKERKLYSNTWYGQLWRIGHSAVKNHCRRYGKNYDHEAMRDAVSTAILQLVESNGDVLQDADAVPAVTFSYMVVREYVREKRASCFYHHEATVLSMDADPALSQIPAAHYPNPCETVTLQDLFPALEDMLFHSPEVLHTLKLTAAGYQQQEIAKAMRCARQTVARRLEKAQDILGTRWTQDLLYK